jgi:hypothetical protein
VQLPALCVLAQHQSAAHDQVDGQCEAGEAAEQGKQDRDFVHPESGAGRGERRLCKAARDGAGTVDLDHPQLRGDLDGAVRQAVRRGDLRPRARGVGRGGKKAALRIREVRGQRLDLRGIERPLRRRRLRLE